MPKVWRFAQAGSIIPLALFGCFAVFGQTENQLEQRYSRSNGFEVRPGVDVYPTFALDGNVCRMVIAKHPSVDNKVGDMNTTISQALVTEIEEELAPEDQRGRELSPYLSPASSSAEHRSFRKTTKTCLLEFMAVVEMHTQS